MPKRRPTLGLVVTRLDGWWTDEEGEVRVASRRISTKTLQKLGADAALRLEPFDRTKPSSWCFGYRRAREGMICWNPALTARPRPGDVDEPCFRLGYEKGRTDASRGIHYEPDYSVSLASSYAETGVRATSAGRHNAVAASRAGSGRGTRGQ
jgi:hypothetical protein